MSEQHDEQWPMEEMLLAKNYTELLPEEHRYLEAQGIDATTYERMQGTLRASREAMQTEQTRVAPVVGQRLRAQFRKQHAGPSLSSVMQYRIPAWQAAAAAVLFVFLFTQMSRTLPRQSEQVIVYHTDTVYKEVPASVAFNGEDSVSSRPIKAQRVVNAPKNNLRSVPTQRQTLRRDTRTYRIPANELRLEGYTENYDTAILNGLIDSYLKGGSNTPRTKVDEQLLDSVARVY